MPTPTSRPGDCGYAIAGTGGESETDHAGLKMPESRQDWNAGKG
jgi:hypothetical protein